jgi:hypothetical protein
VERGGCARQLLLGEEEWGPRNRVAVGSRAEPSGAGWEWEMESLFLLPTSQARFPTSAPRSHPETAVILFAVSVSSVIKKYWSEQEYGL